MGVGSREMEMPPTEVHRHKRGPPAADLAPITNCQVES